MVVIVVINKINNKNCRNISVKKVVKNYFLIGSTLNAHQLYNR